MKGHWYRGKEVGSNIPDPQWSCHDLLQVISGVFPYVGHITNKRWPLNEEYTNHLVRMQQVHLYIIILKKFTFISRHNPSNPIPSQAGLINLENDHEKFELEQSLEKLKLDQFILPFVLLAVGCWAALMIFLTEVLRNKMSLTVEQAETRGSGPPPFQKHELEYKSSVVS